MECHNLATTTRGCMLKPTSQRGLPGPPKHPAQLSLPQNQGMWATVLGRPLQRCELASTRTPRRVLAGARGAREATLTQSFSWQTLRVQVTKFKDPSSKSHTLHGIWDRSSEEKHMGPKALNIGYWDPLGEILSCVRKLLPLVP